MDEPEWPDHLDPETGLFTYFGDNRKPGRAINETAVGGNRLLERVFQLLHDGHRHEVPPFLVFEALKQSGRSYMRFRGFGPCQSP
jgi:hypothetical protein